VSASIFSAKRAGPSSNNRRATWGMIELHIAPLGQIWKSPDPRPSIGITADNSGYPRIPRGRVGYLAPHL
jgi:hypothetical protein